MVSCSLTLKLQLPFFFRYCVIALEFPRNVFFQVCEIPLDCLNGKELNVEQKPGLTMRKQFYVFIYLVEMQPINNKHLST